MRIIRTHPDASCVDILVRAGVARSRSDAKRLIRQGGVRLVSGLAARETPHPVEPGQTVLHRGDIIEFEGYPGYWRRAVVWADLGGRVQLLNENDYTRAEDTGVVDWLIEIDRGQGSSTSLPESPTLI